MCVDTSESMTLISDAMQINYYEAPASGTDTALNKVLQALQDDEAQPPPVSKFLKVNAKHGSLFQFGTSSTAAAEVEVRLITGDGTQILDCSTQSIEITVSDTSQKTLSGNVTHELCDVQGQLPRFQCIAGSAECNLFPTTQTPIYLSSPTGAAKPEPKCYNQLLQKHAVFQITYPVAPIMSKHDYATTYPKCAVSVASLDVQNPVIESLPFSGPSANSALQLSHAQLLLIPCDGAAARAMGLGPTAVIDNGRITSQIPFEAVYPPHGTQAKVFGQTVFVSDTMRSTCRGDFDDNKNAWKVKTQQRLSEDEGSWFEILINFLWAFFAGLLCVGALGRILLYIRKKLPLLFPSLFGDKRSTEENFEAVMTKKMKKSFVKHLWQWQTTVHRKDTKSEEKEATKEPYEKILTESSSAVGYHSNVGFRTGLRIKTPWSTKIADIKKL